MKKRLLHIIPSLDRAGAEKQLALLVSRIPPAEFDVHVCTLTRGGELAADLTAAGVPLTVLGKRWKADPICFWKLRKLIRRLQPDLLHTWMFAPGVYGRLAGRQLGVPHLVHSERCADHWKPRWQWWIDQSLQLHTDRIVANSEGVREYAIEHRMPANKYTIIRNGIAPQPPSRRTKEELLQELDIPAGAPLIGAVGRLWPQKRLRDLIWVAELLHIIRPDVHFLILGEGPERYVLERYVRAIEATDYIHFLGHRSDVPDILPHLDIFWQGSGYEGLPNAVMEAMAAGLPVIATNIPGTSELVLHGKTGYLCPIRGRKEFCRYTDELLENPELRKRLGAAGKERVLREYSVESMVEQHLQLYRELLAK